MLIIPAIDIIEGRCIRLTRGEFNTQKKYHDDPVEVARRWQQQGAGWLHVVDLDGAKYGIVKNLGVAVEIKNKVGLKVQYGGGIRNTKILEKVLVSGIDRAIIGTRAIEDRSFLTKSIKIYGNRVILSVDFGIGGTVYINGWQRKAEVSLLDFSRDLEKLGIKEIIVTDIFRDGTLLGSNLEYIKKILEQTNLNLIIAGGISTIENIIKIKKLEKLGINGVIIGKALYEGTIKLGEAIKIGKAKGER